jgi:hypothetical protein
MAPDPNNPMHNRNVRICLLLSLLYYLYSLDSNFFSCMSIVSEAATAAQRIHTAGYVPGAHYPNRGRDRPPEHGRSGNAAEGHPDGASSPSFHFDLLLAALIRVSFYLYRIKTFRVCIYMCLFPGGGGALRECSS